MHIAFLDSNTDHSAFAQRHPTEVQKFRTLLAPFIDAWNYSNFAVADGLFPEDITGFDGVIISGSPASVNDPDTWVLRLNETIRAAVSADVPIFGACFGHQALATALGGTVARNPQGWVLGRVETGNHAPAPWMHGAAPAMALHAAHNEQVTVTPPGARVLAGNAGVPNGHLALGQRVFSTQYHPELDRAFMLDLLGEMQRDLPPEVLSASRLSLDQGPVDNAVMAQWIVAFFAQAR